MRGGGHLVLGPRSGLKDQFNRLDPRRQPGPLAAVLGGKVEQFYPLDAPVKLQGSAGSGEGAIWAEALSATDAQTRVILSYADAPHSWLAGKAAALQRRYGRGTITYLGTIPDEALMRRLVDAALKDAAVNTGFAVPDKVEVMRRAGAGKEVVVLVNHSREPQAVRLPGSWSDVLHSGAGVETLTLAGEEVAVLRRPLN